MLPQETFLFQSTMYFIWNTCGGWNQGRYNYENWPCWQIAAIYPIKKATTATLAMLTNCSHLSGQESYYGYTHACIKLQTEAMSWIYGTYECWFCMALTSNLKVNSITVCNLYRLWAAYPCLSWSAIAMRVLCRLCSGFPSWCCTSCGISPSPTAGWGRDHLNVLV